MIKLASILAVSLGVMPIAAAQTTEDAKPYSISMSGVLQPSNPSAVSYPYLAAERGMDGSCEIAMHLDANGSVAALSILGCSSPIFAESADSFIDAQETPGNIDQIVRAVPLKINWAFDDTAAEPVLSASS